MTDRTPQIGNLQHPDSHRPSVTIVVPVFNEEASLEQLKGKLAQLHRALLPHYRVSFCLVDDGSTDRTFEGLAGVCPEDATLQLLRHETNQGVGASFQTAFANVKSDIVCTLDADCSYPPIDLMKLINLVSSGEAEVATGSPYHPTGNVDGVPPWRLLLSMQCSLLYRIFFPLKLYTYTSILRAYRGSVTQNIAFTHRDFVSAVEILLEAHRMGNRIAEVPLTLHGRKTGRSKMRVLKTILSHILFASGYAMRLYALRLRDAVGGLATGNEIAVLPMCTPVVLSGNRWSATSREN